MNFLKSSLALLTIACNLLILQAECVWVQPPATLTFNPPTQINGRQDNSGNAVILFLDPSNVYMGTIYLASTQSWSTPEPVIDVASGVASVPSATINNSGAALALWVQTGVSDTLQYAVHTPSGWVNQGIVATAVPGATFSQPLVVSDASGNALAIFFQNDGGLQTVFTASYDGNGWTTQVLEALPIGSNLESYNVVLDNAGDGAVIWAVKDGANNLTISAKNYASNTQIFSPTTPLFSGPAGSGVQLQTSISDAGKILVAWNINPNGLYAAIYNNGWLPTETIVGPINGAFASEGSTSINDSGNALIVYSYNETINSILAASFDGSTWTPQTVATSLTFTLFNTVAGIDPQGDGIAFWVSTSDPIGFSNSTIQSSTRIGLNGSWSTPSQTFAEGTPGNASLPLMIKFNQMNNAYFVWALLNPLNGNFAEINISFGYDLFIPFSPSNFQGTRIKNRFLTQTDLINSLTWNPSPNAAVTSYQLFRNGVVIAEIAAQGPYVYLDHNRYPKVPDTYQLWSVINGVLQSVPQTTVVP